MPDSSSKPAPKPFDEALRRQLAEYRSEKKLTNKELARQLGTSDTAVSKYLSGKPEGDVEKLEAVIADVLAAAKQKVTASTELFDSPIARALAGSLETIRKTGDVGLLYGGAGLGKTCGIRIYRRSTPSSIPVFVTPWRANPNGIISAIFEGMDKSKWNGNQPRADFITERLSGSDRQIGRAHV